MNINCRGYWLGEYFIGRIPNGRWIKFISQEEYLEYMEENTWPE